MWYYSRGERCGRNIWGSITQGTLTIRNRDEVKQITVVGYDVQRVRLYKGKQLQSDIWYGRREIVRHGKKLVTIPYRAGTNRAQARAWYRAKTLTQRNVPLYPGCRFMGTRHTVWYGNSLQREWFTYPNGKEAYRVSRSKLADFTVVSPDGKTLAWQSHYGLNLVADYRTLREEQSAIGPYMVHLRKGEVNNTPANGATFQFRTHDTNGRIRSYGQYETSQRTGKWGSGDGTLTWYLRGVPVSQHIYEAKPEELAASEVLAIQNAQLRASLLSRIGLQRVITECQGTTLDHTDAGEALVSIPMPQLQETDDLDPTLNILKVVCPSTHTEYYLRVPPTMTKCREARLWTLGVNRTEDASNIELVAET